MQDQRVASELVSLRDVEGVIGSFVLGEAGTVLGRDLPNLFDADVLSAVGLRVHRLLESLDDSQEAGAHMTLRYPEHKLYLHRAQQAVIGVISGPDASTPAMTMALTLVGRRISRALETASAPTETESFARTLPSSAPTLPAVPRPVASTSGSLPHTGPSPSAMTAAAPGTPAAPGNVAAPGNATPGQAPPPPPTRYSVTAGVPRAPEGQQAAPSPSARPRYFRGRRVD